MYSAIQYSTDRSLSAAPEASSLTPLPQIQLSQALPFDLWNNNIGLRGYIIVCFCLDDSCNMVAR